MTGQLSSSTLTLQALFILEGSGPQRAYTNMITHLTRDRVRRLVSEGMSFIDAVTQAELELLSELDITGPDYLPGVLATGMNVAGGDSDDNAYLLAVSSVLTTVAANRSGPIEANVQEVLNRAALDLREGTLSQNLKNEITEALSFNVDRIARRLEARLRATCSNATVPNMHRVLDQDRDGIVNIDDNCPLVPNPDHLD